jgi:hypothetical protein
VVVTKAACDKAAPDGSLWDTVMGKLQALHPEPTHTLTHEFFPHPTQETWPTVLSRDQKMIHFAAKGLALFKGTTEQWHRLLERDPDLDLNDWGVRPIAIGWGETPKRVAPRHARSSWSRHK